MKFWSVVVAALWSIAAPPAWAASVATTTHFSASLVAESRAPAAGSTVAVAVAIRLAPGWHTYWQNPGESGLPPALQWRLPAAVTHGQVRYPVPTELVEQGIASNVYLGHVTLLTHLHLARRLAAGTALPVGATLKLLVCSEGLCVPESTTVNTHLSVGNGAADPAVASLFSAARAALPRILDTPVHYTVKGDSIALALPARLGRNLASARVFVQDQGVMPAAEHVETRPDALVVSLPHAGLHKNGRLHGVLRIVDNEGRVTGIAFTAMPPQTRTLDTRFWIALGAAILGGLLLNLMPCVFPILSLKALTLARAAGDATEARLEALGYTFGAVAMLVALGGIILAARQAGHAVGWAFQLQNTHIVALLLLLVTAIATNLAGLFELPSIAFSLPHGKGVGGGIATGALAAFIATPCTGPFMAGALGAALVLPTAAALAVFAGLGLGLALPFLCLGFVAPLRRLMPRPGPWMQTLRRLLSLPMFATAVGLVWIVGRQAGVSAMAVSLSASLLLGVALWWYGLRQAARRPVYPALVPAACAVLVALAALPSPAAATAAGSDLLHGKPYTAARLAALRARHRPVFVYLTADWCLTCKVNEATSLSAPSVANAFHKAHVAVLRGDWTRRNPQVTALLVARGRAGVPLYLWYPARGPVRELPQVLTPSMLVNLAAAPASPPDNTPAS